METIDEIISEKAGKEWGSNKLRTIDLLFETFKISSFNGTSALKQIVIKHTDCVSTEFKKRKLPICMEKYQKQSSGRNLPSGGKNLKQ